MRESPRTVRSGRDERGFTLVELMIVLVILSVLSAIGLSGYAVFKIRAQESLVKNLARLVKVETDTWVNDFGSDQHWGGNYDTAFLNGQLEKVLETSAPGSIRGTRNPVSGSQAVINWTDVLVAESNPAIQITNNVDYSYAGMGTDAVHPELRGTVVVYLDNGVPAVDIFYVDLFGKRSSLLFTSVAEGGATGSAASAGSSGTSAEPATTPPAATTTPTATAPPTVTSDPTDTTTATPPTTTTTPAADTQSLTKEQLKKAQELAKEQAKKAAELAKEQAKEAQKKKK